MRTIRRSTRFEKDLKRLLHSQYRSAIVRDLPAMLDLLAQDQPLPANARDHPLTGEKASYRDCHLRPDLVLIYRKTADELLLARLGTHSELSL